MYAQANMGHPSRECGFVLRSDYKAADELHVALSMAQEPYSTSETRSGSNGAVRALRNAR
jgi:hypothetical protein